MPRIADLEARITANTGDFDKKVNQSRDHLGRFVKGMDDGGKSVGKLSGMLQVFAGNMLTTVVSGLLQATKAVGAFGDECAEAASDVSESEKRAVVSLPSRWCGERRLLLRVKRGKGFF